MPAKEVSSLEYVSIYNIVVIFRAHVVQDGTVHSGVSEVIDILDSYGLSREDLMETMQQLQFVVSSEAQLQDHFAFMVSQ